MHKKTAVAKKAAAAVFLQTHAYPLSPRANKQSASKQISWLSHRQQTASSQVSPMTDFHRAIRLHEHSGGTAPDLNRIPNSPTISYAKLSALKCLIYNVFMLYYRSCFVNGNAPCVVNRFPVSFPEYCPYRNRNIGKHEQRESKHVKQLFKGACMNHFPLRNCGYRAQDKQCQIHV